jgi:hypothetical protein
MKVWELVCVPKGQLAQNRDYTHHGLALGT